MTVAGRQLPRARIAVFTLVVATVACLVGGWKDHIFEQPDSTHYLALAQSQPVMMPFASRQLAPLLARAFMHLFGAEIHTAFVVEGVLAMVCFVALIALLMVRRETPWWVLVGIGGMAFWAQQFISLMMPDLLYAALLALFLMLLHQKRNLAAALMMFPLTVSRESTLLTLLCFIVAGWRVLRKREIAAAMASTLAGILLVKRLASNALPNNEHISPTLYPIVKMPWTFLKNVLGVDVWADIYPTCANPPWKIPLHLGPLHVIGACKFFNGAPLIVFGFGLAAFGLLPLLLLRLGRGRMRSDSRDSLLLRFCVLYGAISFVLAPVLGESVLRLYGFSWPLFLIAIPILLTARRAVFKSTSAAVLFLALHLFLCWAMFWVPYVQLFILALVTYVAGWLLLRRTFEVDPVYAPGLPS